MAGVRFAELGTPFGTRSQARSNTTDGEPSHRGGTWLEQAISRLQHASPSIPTHRPHPEAPAKVLPLMPYPSGERGATVAAEVPHTKRGSMYGLKRDVARLCATGRVMLAAMPTDAATEAVEHVRNLASERRVVFDPAEPTMTWHASAGGAL